MGDDSGGGLFSKGRLLIAIAIALFSAFSYFGLKQTNPTTGEVQRIDISPQQEIALGVRAAPDMAAQFGGLDPTPGAQEKVAAVGQRIVRSSQASRSPYQFGFHALADRNTVNAFALPGGQIFVTRALMSRLNSEGQLAGVLAHETGHVIARHSAEQMAKQRLTQGLTGAAVIASTDPTDPSTYRNAAVASLIGQLVTMKFSRNDESEADAWGVRLMSQAGYDPRAMLEVMKVLKQAGGPSGPEFFQTHPSPENRLQQISAEIAKLFPNGVPPGLIARASPGGAGRA